MWSPKGANCWEDFESKKSLLRFYANMSSLHESIGYVNITDCLEICSEDSQDTNRVGDSVFQNGSPAMASDVLRIGKILISKLDRLRAKQPIRILKKSPHGMKTNPSGLKLCRRSFVRSDSICDSFPQRNIVHFELSRLIRISIRSS